MWHRLGPRIVGLAVLLGCTTSPAFSSTPAELHVDPRRDPQLELEAAATLATMGDELREAGEVERGRALLLHARRIYAGVAQYTTDPTFARLASELQFELVERALGSSETPSTAPSRQLCKTSSQGVCVYLRKRGRRAPHAPAFIPYDEAELERLAAHELYEAHAAPGDTLRDRRHRHIRLRMDHADFAAARPLLERYVVDYDGHISSVWAAVMLVEVLAIPVVMEGDEAAIEPLLAWAERLPGMALWDHPEAEALRYELPVLHAGAMWRAAVHARDRGEQAALARREANPNADQPPPDPADHFERCAEIFVAIYNTFENHDYPDALLSNAADCHDAAGQPGNALLLRERLIERFPAPDGEYFRDTLRRVADMESTIFEIEDAGAHYLEFFRLYPKHPDAPEVLLRALEVERALGHDAIVAELERAYVERYERLDVKKTAGLVWSWRPQAPDQLLAYAVQFERSYARRAAAEWLDATRVIVELSWDRACRHRLADGLCVARTEPRNSSACTLGGVALSRVRPRDRARAREAANRIEGARTLSEGHFTLAQQDQPILARLRAAVAFHALEAELEAYLAAGADAPDADARAEVLDRGYAEVVTVGEVDYAIRAHARRAMVWELLANAGLERRDGVCKPLTPAAEQLAARARSAYEDCLELAVTRSWFNNAARRCEHALAVIDPVAFAPMNELVGTPEDIVGSGIASVGVVFDPW